MKEVRSGRASRTRLPPRGWEAESGERFLNSREIGWDRGKHLKDQRVKQLICGSLHREPHGHLPQAVYPALDACPPVHARARAGAWGVESGPGVRTAVDCGGMVRGDGRKDICNRECLWRKA